jgi:NAD(P)H-dependent FMN reductase
MKILAFAVSRRLESSNRRVLDVIAGRLRTRGIEVDLAGWDEFDMPLFDADLHSAAGVPPGAAEFARRINGADALVIVSPEYNHGPPATLKSALEWISRLSPVPVSGKPALLASATSSPVGGVRGLIFLREVLASLGVWVAPHVFGVGRAGDAFTAEGELKNEKQSQDLDAMLERFIRVATAISKV